MSLRCENCGADRPELPGWILLVPVAIGAVSLALIVLFKGRLPGRILAGIVTAAFVIFTAWLAMKLKSVLSSRCPKCGQRAD